MADRPLVNFISSIHIILVIGFQLSQPIMGDIGGFRGAAGPHPPRSKLKHFIFEMFFFMNLGTLKNSRRNRLTLYFGVSGDTFDYLKVL